MLAWFDQHDPLAALGLLAELAYRQAGVCAWVAAVEAWLGALTGDSFSLGAGVVCCGLASLLWWWR
jgi:hypothetical protein